MRVTNLFRNRSKRRRRRFPAQLIDILEERRVGAQRREFLEEQGALTILLLKNLKRKLFDVAMLIDEFRGGLCAQARDSRITIGGVAHQRQIVRDELRRDAKLRADGFGIANLI